ncbi:hypothetical protein EGK59_15795 [Acinetobacter soli]|nr:hypothetical protein EGK59_15795 [Acinetobacter soli]
MLGFLVWAYIHTYIFIRISVFRLLLFLHGFQLCMKFMKAACRFIIERLVSRTSPGYAVVLSS